MKTFRINKNYEIICDWQQTRNGFKHIAKLKKHIPQSFNGGYMGVISETKVCYLNRTWESFEYETVIKKLLSFNTDIIPKGTQTRFLNKISGNVKKEIASQFKSIAMVASLGNLLCKDQKETNDWKTRMLKAGLENQGLIMPEDWNELTEEDKETRLNNVISHLQTA